MTPFFFLFCLSFYFSLLHVQGGEGTVEYSFLRGDLAREEKLQAARQWLAGGSEHTHKKSLDFLLIGAQKGGTSSLSQWMSAHPQINRPKAKELLYWSNCAKSIDQYFLHFPDPLPRGNISHFATGEFSATYLFSQPLCLPPLLHSINPHLRLIAVLREPSRRAHSHFVEQRDFCDCPPRVKEYCGCRPNHKLVMAYNGSFGRYGRDQVTSLSECVKEMEWREEWLLDTAESAVELGDDVVPWSPLGVPKYLRWKSRAIASQLKLRRYLSCIQMRSRPLFFQSLYDAFLANFLLVFPAHQLLVLYTETDLAPSNVSATMRLIETHLNISHYPLDPSFFKVYNGKGCYGWRTECAEQSSESRDQFKEEVGEEDRLAMKKFFLPSVMNLVAMAQRGLIRPPPPSWLS
jgi:hypothetical protein